MHKFSAGSEEQKVAQLEKEEKGKMDIAPSSEREAGLNLQKGKTKKHTHLNP